MKTKTCVEEVTKQDLLDFMGWMRKQPLPKRKHSNPERTYADKIGHVAIFLKEFKVGHGLKKKEYPRYAEKRSLPRTVKHLARIENAWFPVSQFSGTAGF